MKKLIGMFAIASIGGATALTLNHYFIEKKVAQAPNNIGYQVPTKYVNLAKSAPESTIDFTTAAEMSVHTVVNVKTTFHYETQNQYIYDPFFGFFSQRSPQRREAPVGSGSGVIISEDGYIVTNNHVIDDADKIEITLNDKRTYVAEVIGKDPTTDLALLKIKENNLPFVTYGNSDDVKVGEWVLAVGNPFNLTSTVTAGIISAKARNINIIGNDLAKDINPVESFLQTDAAVNPGNSGGALVNARGELIGINSAIASNTGSYTGYSFAIPVNMARKVVADLLEFGEVQRAYLGVNIRDIDAKLAEEKNISDLKGVYIAGVTEGGAGDKAGVKEGDIVIKVADVAVNNIPELQEQVSRYRPGDKINITLKRNNQEKVMALVLKNRNGTLDVVERPKIEIVSALGATLEPITELEMKKLNVANGLKISKLGAGKLLSAGIKEGFVITSIDKKKVSSVEDVKTILANKKGGVLIEGIYPNGMRAYYGFGL